MPLGEVAISLVKPGISGISQSKTEKVASKGGGAASLPAVGISPFHQLLGTR